MAESSEKTDPYFTAMKALFWVLFAGVFAFAAVQAWPVIQRIVAIMTPFILGLLLAYVFYPIVVLVQKRLKLGRVTGILAVALCIFTIGAVIFAVLLPVLYQQTASLLDGLVQYFSSERVDAFLQRFLTEGQSLEDLRDIMKGWLENLRENLTSALQSKPDLIEPVAAGSIGAVRGAIQATLSVFGWLGGFAATIVLSVIVAFYCLVGMEKVPAIIRRMLPGDDPERVWESLVKADAAVGGFLRGQLIACTGVGILASILLLLVGLKQYAVLIGFIAGAVNFIPYLGPAFGATPAILWALMSPSHEAWGERGLYVGLILGGFAVIQMIDGFIFQPLIVGKQAALHPLAVMLALVVGAQFGIGGMILAVPAACVIKVFFVEFYWKKTKDFLL